MKKIIMICCMIAVTILKVNAQHLPLKVVSSAEFSEKAAELNATLKQGDRELLKVKWEAIHELMIQELALVKDRIYFATINNNESDLMRFDQILDKQVEVYWAIIGIRNSAFKDASLLQDKLSAFSSTLIN